MPTSKEVGIAIIEAREVGEVMKYSWRDDALCSKIMFLTPEEIQECEDSEESIYTRNTTKAHEIFFSTKGETRLVNQAKKICSQCPVSEDCLAFALKMNLRDGVWGGSSARARRRVRQMKSIAQATFDFNNPETLSNLEDMTLEQLDESQEWVSFEDLEYDASADDPWEDVWAADDYLKGLGLDDI